MTITEFLLARITEDEAVARRVDSGPPIVQQLQAGIDHESGSLSGWVEVDAGRVLAECEAKRRIVEATFFSDDPRSAVDFWMDQSVPVPREQAFMVQAIKLLALPYADHPDYDEAWRP